MNTDQNTPSLTEQKQPTDTPVISATGTTISDSSMVDLMAITTLYNDDGSLNETLITQIWKSINTDKEIITRIINNKIPGYEKLFSPNIYCRYDINFDWLWAEFPSAIALWVITCRERFIEILLQNDALDVVRAVFIEYRQGYTINLPEHQEEVKGFNYTILADMFYCEWAYIAGHGYDDERITPKSVQELMCATLQFPPEYQEMVWTPIPGGNASYKRRYDPLYRAIKNGHLGIAYLLIEAGAPENEWTESAVRELLVEEIETDSWHNIPKIYSFKPALFEENKTVYLLAEAIIDRIFYKGLKEIPLLLSALKNISPTPEFWKKLCTMKCGFNKNQVTLQALLSDQTLLDMLREYGFNPEAVGHEVTLPPTKQCTAQYILYNSGYSTQLHWALQELSETKLWGTEIKSSTAASTAATSTSRITTDSDFKTDAKITSKTQKEAKTVSAPVDDLDTKHSASRKIAEVETVRINLARLVLIPGFISVTPITFRQYLNSLSDINKRQRIMKNCPTLEDQTLTVVELTPEQATTLYKNCAKWRHSYNLFSKTTTGCKMLKALNPFFTTVTLDDEEKSPRNKIANRMTSLFNKQNHPPSSKPPETKSTDMPHSTYRK